MKDDLDAPNSRSECQHKAPSVSWGLYTGHERGARVYERKINDTIVPNSRSECQHKAPSVSWGILYQTEQQELAYASDRLLLHMPKSYTNLLYHIVFSTHERRPIITSARRPRLYDYVGGIIRELGGIALAIGGVEDHLHLLAKLRPDKALSDLLRDLKANSSGWMHSVFPDADEFYWQKGYGAFTVSASQVPAVSRYIADQERHHQTRSFRDEFVAMLRANEIEFDERFLWS